MMKLADFVIGQEFWGGGRQWRCTDIGTRTIVAIRLGEVRVGSDRPERRRFASQVEARIACFSFIEGFYNPTRRHSALGYRSPIRYEEEMQTEVQSAKP